MSDYPKCQACAMDENADACPPETRWTNEVGRVCILWLAYLLATASRSRGFSSSGDGIH